jgi:hypothetical protein
MKGIPPGAKVDAIANTLGFVHPEYIGEESHRLIEPGAFQFKVCELRKKPIHRSHPLLRARPHVLNTPRGDGEPIGYVSRK